MTSTGERPLAAAWDLEDVVLRLRSLGEAVRDGEERRRLIALALGAFWRRTYPFAVERPARREPGLLDAILFNGEWELLEHRLSTLAEVTTGTLVVEANRTFAGQPRDFLLTAAALEERGWQDRVSVRQVELPEALDQPEIAEAIQRNRLVDLVAREACEGDRVLLSDIDEIPFAEALRRAGSGITALGLRQSVYFANHERVAGPVVRHFGPVIVPAVEFTRRTPAELRNDARTAPAGKFKVLLDAGIHLQHAGAGDRLPARLAALGHDPEAIAGHLDARRSVQDGIALAGYACLTTDDRSYPVGLAAVDEARLADALEYVIARTDRATGRRRAPVPDTLAPPPGRRPR